MLSGLERYNQGQGGDDILAAGENEAFADESMAMWLAEHFLISCVPLPTF